MNANSVLLQKKYSRIVEMFAEQSKLTLDEALTLPAFAGRRFGFALYE